MVIVEGFALAPTVMVQDFALTSKVRVVEVVVLNVMAEEDLVFVVVSLADVLWDLGFVLEGLVEYFAVLDLTG